MEFDGSVSAETMSEMVEEAIRQEAEIDADTISEFDGLLEADLLTKMTAYALDKGVYFNADQILQLDGIVSTEILNRAARESNKKFSESDLLSLEGVIDEAVLEELEDRLWPVKNKADEDHITNNPALKAKKQGFLKGFVSMPGKKYRPLGNPFRAGDHVRVRFRGQEGTVVDINGSLIMVSLDGGSHVDSYMASQLEKAQ